MAQIEKVLPSKIEENKELSIVQKLYLILISALIFGLGWHIRGSGTSDPTVVILLFILLIGAVFSPKIKFNCVIFGLIVLVFRAMRRGWGTFVGQAGLPGLYEGFLASSSEGYSLIVPWWQGYFWLFFVGVAWSGLPSLLIGGYFFSDKKYKFKDLLICCVIFTAGYFIGILFAQLLIPIISPDAYTEIYLAGLSERNYKSMKDNLAISFAIIPVYIYIALKHKDYKLIQRSLIIIIIFGLGLSLADIWQVMGRNNPAWGIPFWSLWEYTTGFIIGGLLMMVYLMLPKRDWQNANLEPEKYPNTKFNHIFFRYFIGHVALFLYGLQESIIGMINSTSSALGSSLDVGTAIGVAVILIIDLPIYYFGEKKGWFSKFRNNSFKEKCLILLIVLFPVYFLCYSMQFIVTGQIFHLGLSHLATIFDVISFIIAESSLIIWLIVFNMKKKKIRNNVEVVEK